MASKPRTNLSPTMLQLIEYMRANGNSIARHPGGFWAAEDWRGTGTSFGTTSVQALIDRKVATYTKYKQGRHAPFPVEATVIPSLAVCATSREAETGSRQAAGLGPAPANVSGQNAEKREVRRG